MPLLDWYAAHLDPQVDEIVRCKGHGPVLRLGGGITGLVQVPDTHNHDEQARLYKLAEQRDMARQRELRPSKVPSSTKQDVVTRGHDVWRQLDHSRSVSGHKADGITSRLHK